MKSVLLIFSLLFGSLCANAQNYPDVLSYYVNGTPVNGVKIKTNLPFTNSSQMPTIIIEGFNFANETINLTITYYVYNNIFYRGVISTSGSYNPPVYLAGENGKVVIFMDSKAYFQRFHVRAFAAGLSADNAASYTGWTTVDSTLSTGATATLLLPYQNRFSGDVYLPGNSVWNANGKVGIGTTTPGNYQLAVEGTMGARKVQVKQSTWADFVFKSDYQLAPLLELESYINSNQHLPGIPSEAEVQKDGIDVGEMNKLLLQKVEELTLYIIDMRKEIDKLKTEKR